MRGLVVTVVLASSAALAQAEEYALPDFAHPDAGAPAPQPGADEFALPDFARVPSTSPPPLMQGPVQSAPLPPPPPRWAPFSATINAGLAGLTSYEGWFDGGLYGLAYSTQRVSDDQPGELEGWLLQVGASASFGFTGGAFCQGSAFCGNRLTGGGSARLGWGHGTPGVRDGVTRPRFFTFGQLDALLGHFTVESAPLSPGVRTWEFVTRLRGGVMINTGGGTATSSGVTFSFAAVVQLVAVGQGTQGVLLGAAVGLAL